MTILTVSAGLLLIFIFNVGFLADRLAVSNLRFGKFNLYFIFVFQTTCNHFQMLLTHAVKQSLTVLGIVDYAQRLIFVCQLLQRLGNLIDIRLVNRFIALCSIRLGIFGLRISNRICLGGKRITGLCAGQLCKCTEVAGMQLAHFDRFVALHHIQLADLCLNIAVAVIHRIVRFEYTGANLNQGILTDEGIGNRLIDVCGFRFGEIIIRLENAVCL